MKTYIDSGTSFLYFDSETIDKMVANFNKEYE